MSNKSFSIKENPYMKDIQGGEKKVMKKILSVALSTAMAFSMFASVAFGADAEKLTPEQQFNVLKEAGIVDGFPDGLAHLDQTVTRAQLAKIIVKSLALEEVTGVATYKDKNYTAKHWAAPFIEAATKAGILEGVSTNPANPLFNPTGNVTVQELAKVLVVANKLEVPTEANNTASEWAKGYVAAAIKAGYIAEGINYQANATRAQTVVAAHAIYEFNNFKVTKAEAIDANNVKLTLSTGEVVEVKLEKALEANKATELTYKAKDGRELKYTVTWVLTTATKVEKVSASNLREVNVAFDGEVDQATAEDESNYSINGDINVKAAKLSADKKTVVLTVADKTNPETKGLTNQKEYKIDVTNVRAGNVVINASEVKFTPVDAELPTAVSAEALGNRAFKVTFSEPVVASSVSANNFKIDGASVVGTIDVSGKVAVVKLYSAVAVGEHTINVAGVKDFSNLANLATDLKVNVVEDKEAPTVAVEKATFEEVTLKFSETVDKSTVTAGNIYWLDSATKRYASTVEALSDDTYKVTFNTTNALKYPTSLYVQNVADYSGNVIAANTAVAVNPVVDQTRPEVVSVKFLEKSSTDFDVKFNKVLTQKTAEDAANYVIKKADGTVVSNFKTAKLDSTGKVVRIHLYTALDAGKEYTIEIANVSDGTTLKNVMMPYSGKISLGDTTPPKLDGASVSNTDHRIVVNFDEAMTTGGAGSILDKANYIYYKGGSYDSTAKTFSGGVWTALPSDATIIASSDSKSAIIIFPTDFVRSDVTGIRVSSVKDLAGNTLDGLVAETPVAATALSVTAVGAKATEVNKIEVEFNQNIQSGSATTSDFIVRAGGTDALSVVSANVDGKKVVLTLSEDLDTNAQHKGRPVSIQVVANRNIVTPTGTKVVADQTPSLVDAIKPAIKSISNEVIDGAVNVEFTEDVAITDATAGYDFEVLADGKALPFDATGFTVTTVDTKNVKLTLASSVVTANKGKVLTVRIKPNPSIIKDAPAGNLVAGGSSFFSSYISDGVSDSVAVANAKTALTLTVATPAAASSTIALPSSGTNGTTIEWKVAGTAVTTGTTTVTRAAAAATVTIEATIKKGTESTTKTFTVNVPETTATTDNITVTP